MTRNKTAAGLDDLCFGTCVARLAASRRTGSCGFQAGIANGRSAGRISAVPQCFLACQGAGLRRTNPGGSGKQSRRAGSFWRELSAPEMAARIAEAESKVQAIESDRLQAEAQLAAAQSTYDRLKKAAETPGAIAGNELIQMRKAGGGGAGLGPLTRASQACRGSVRGRGKRDAVLPADHGAL